MTSALRVRVLGPLEVLVGDRPVTVPGVRQRSLLALLALRRRQVVGIDRIATALWPDDEPADAGRAIVVYVRRLRQALAAGGVDAGVVVTRTGGYLLDLETDEVDADEFRALLGRGERALLAGRPGEAAIVLRQALAVWSAQPLLGLGPSVARWPEIATLVELRWAALSARVDADLALGRGADIVPELRALVAADPLQERSRTWLMAALRSAGRTVDALQVYREGRALLVRATGLEPGPALRREQAAALSADRRDRTGDASDAHAGGGAGRPAGPAVIGRAGTVLQDAARFAAEVGGHQVAARCWQAALDLHTGPERERGRLLVGLGTARGETGEDGREDLRTAYDLLLAAGDAEGAAEAAMALARAEWLAGRGAPARTLVASATALVRSLPPSRATAHVLGAGVGLTVLFGSPDPVAAAAAVRHAEAVDAGPDVLARSLCSQGLARLHAGDLTGVRDMERAVQVLRRSCGWAPVSYLVNLFDAYARSGRPDLARRALDEADAAAALGASESDRRWIAMHRIQVDWWAGRYAEVARLAGEVGAAGPQDYAAITAALMLARLRLRAGDVAGALDRAARASRMAAGLGDDQAVLVTLAVEARVRAAGGDPAGATRLLAGAGALGVSLFDPLAGSDLGVAVRATGTGLDLFDAFVPTPWVTATRELAGGDRLRAARIYRQLGSVADAEVAMGEHSPERRNAVADL